MFDDEISKLLERVVSSLKRTRNTSMKEACKIGIIDIDNWEWAQGVGIYGLYCCARELENDEALDWLGKWIDKNIEKGLPERNVNTTAPLLTVSALGKDTGNEKYLAICREWAEWIIKDLPRTKFGGFQHVISNALNHMQLWDDTLFMTVLFIAQMAMIDNKEEYLKECEYQFLLHSNYLQDRRTGLWFHGWTFEDSHNFANALWGRGNCWITAFIPDYLEITEGNCSIKRYMISVLNAQVEALKKYQDSSGLWHTLIDDESSYLEVSATAGFAYGILKGIRMGILSEEYHEMAMKAAKGVIDNIAEDGTVLNVSYGTGVGKTLQDYRDVPICPMTYGQALTIMLLTELMKH